MEVCLRLNGCFSLKDKRQVLRSLIDKARRDFHVAIAEVDDHDLWNVATLGIACVSNAPDHVESILQHVMDAIDSNPNVAVEGIVREISRT